MGKRVYRNEYSRTVNFDGAQPQAPENLFKEIDAETQKFRVRLITSNAFFFNAKWQKVADQDGNTFSNTEDLMIYINKTFAPFEIYGGRQIT